MTSTFSLIEVLWRPEEVLRRKLTWFLPYVSSVLLVGILGLYTRHRLGDQLSIQLQQMGVDAEGIALFERGSYIGIAVVAFVLPIVIPWGAAFVSKFLALLLGSRVTFSEFFSLYQWGYYVSTLVSVLLKGILFILLPVEAWGNVTLSLAAFIPDSAPAVLAVAGAFDLALLILFAAALIGLKGRKGRQELAIPVRTLLAFLVVQVTVAW